MMNDDPQIRSLIATLCRQFYDQGWVSGTGGGISIRSGDTVYLAPSGVPKERINPDDLFLLNREGDIVQRPTSDALKPSECQHLFYNAYNLRDAGAVLHSHSLNAMLVTLLYDDVFRVTHLEMMKGITGVGYHDVCEVPIINNTAHECELTETMADAMKAYPKSHAVLVRRHGVYVWGDDWKQAKKHAECYDYLFAAAVRMKQMGLDPARMPEATL
jgi:methylthioribulose-1-phosphate dehydratase